MTIFYLFSKPNRISIDHYLGTWGAQHFRYILPIPYEEIAKKTVYPPGIYIFSDLDVLHHDKLADLLPLWETLTAKGYSVFNHPIESKCRFELLKLLHFRKINVFNVYRLDDDLSEMRYPVFLRKSDDHTGSQSDLINDSATLTLEINKIRNASTDLTDWMITEFCDVRDQNGIFKKYGAFYINNTIIPRHVFFSKHWVQKYPTELTEIDILKKEHEYLKDNPHEQKLKEIFSLSGIDYGRIDYGIKDGKIQVWEINTNPIILSPSHVAKKTLRYEQHRHFHRRFSDSLNSLHGRTTTRLPISYYKDLFGRSYSYAYVKWKASALWTFLKSVRVKLLSVFAH